ncbi:MAG: GntR family transcriptional regulator [Alphaproteobacteria bacterium]|nr:GntR family transcriptional regulator [Alphaproteobacteria bacterium]
MREGDAPAAAPAHAPVRPAALQFRTKESQVAEFLRERIISGYFARGQKLKQAEIAQMLDLSITPVREALKLLEAQGYVLGSSHRGAVVAPFQVGEAEELFDLRLLLETRLTLEASRRIDPAAIGALEAINQEIARAARRHDNDAVRSANFRFHFRLYEIAGQAQTLHFVRILWAKYPFDLLTVMPRRQFGVRDEHRAILEALRAGDPDAAARSMQDHIRSGWEMFKRHYPEQPAG